MYEIIPEELKKIDRWVCWQMEERDGKLTKVPYNPMSGGRAMSNNPATWGTFYDAVEKSSSFDGIGFMFNGDGIVGVDIDHCKENGIMSDVARDIINTLDSYTEYSQSGNGIHIICYGKLPSGRKRKDSVEMYETGRFFVMTGNVLDDAHTGIEARTEELAEVHKKYLNEQKKKIIQKTAEIVHNLSDDEIISKALDGKNGDLFGQLMNGSWKGRYKSQSEADLALCNILAFYTGRDYSAIDRIFRRSGLYREKWEERRSDGTYGSATIKLAVQDCDQTYTPGRKKEQQQKRERKPPDNNNTSVEPLKLPEWITGPYNDMWNAERLIEKHGSNMKYNKTKGSWFIWDSKRWREDHKDNIRNMADDTIISLYQYKSLMWQKYGDSKDDKKYSSFIGWLGKARNTARKNNMITEAESWPGVSAVSDDFDNNEWMFNCANGTIDLKTGKLMPHKKYDLITKMSPVEFHPNEKAPVFEKFMNKIFEEKKHLIAFIQRAIGYSLTGTTKEQCIFVCHGSGANGKSTLIGTIQDMLGDYARNTNFTTFTVRNDSNTNDIARLMGSRFVTAMEVGEDKRLNEALIKQLSGGDMISARYLHKEFFDFYPTFKIWMGANHKPKIKETDNGIWRRIKLIPFEVTIPPEERDGDLPFKLKKELPGILAWAVRGCIKWQKEGLNPPAEVNAATDTYRGEMDVMQAFLSDCTIEKEDGIVKSGDLYRVYSEWCDENGEHAFSSTKFALKLKERGIKKSKTKTMRTWEGLELTPAGKQFMYSRYEGKKQNDDYEQTGFPWENM